MSVNCKWVTAQAGRFNFTVWCHDLPFSGKNNSSTFRAGGPF